VFSRLALACVLVQLLAIPAIAQLSAPQEPPALVGTWVLRVPNSEVLPPPDIKSQTIAITCVGEKIEISATTNGEESVAQFTADGKQRKGRTIPPLLHGEVVTSRWEGTSLVLTIVGGSWVTGESVTTERWTPSLDGRTLTRSWGGFKMLEMVYDKRPTPDRLDQLTPRGYVNDFAGIIDSAAQSQLDAICKDLDRKKRTQMAIVTIVSLDGSPVVEFATQLGNRWGVGYEDNHRGVVVLLSRKEHQWGIATGKGLESVLTNDYEARLGREMTPFLRNGHYGTALLWVAQRIHDEILQNVN
jgi:TPM domain